MTLQQYLSTLPCLLLPTDPIWIFYHSLLSLAVCLGHIVSPALPTPLQTAGLCSDIFLGDCLSGLKDLHLALLGFSRDQANS